MSFYRSLLAAVAAIAIASPVFADDTTANTTTTGTDATAATQPAAAATETQGVKVNINTATAKELTQIKGISTSKAKAIVAYRKKLTDQKFTSLDQLANVKGFKKMKPEMMKSITDQLTVE